MESATLSPPPAGSAPRAHASAEGPSAWAQPTWALLRHIVSHSTYHRGQVASKLKCFGIEQPITDFFWWAIEQIPREA